MSLNIAPRSSVSPQPAQFWEEFYFIANTGIANYKDGKVVDPSKLEPINIGVIQLD